MTISKINIRNNGKGREDSFSAKLSLNIDAKENVSFKYDAFSGYIAAGYGATEREAIKNLNFVLIKSVVRIENILESDFEIAHYRAKDINEWACSKKIVEWYLKKGWEED